MHTGFRVELSHDRTAYLIADKGIEKRIQNILWKKYGLASNVIYELIPSDNIYLDGSLRIKIVDDKWRFDVYSYLDWWRMSIWKRFGGRVWVEY